MSTRIVIPLKQIVRKFVALGSAVALSAVSLTSVSVSPAMADTFTEQEKAVICGIDIPQYEASGWRFVMNFNHGTPTGCMIAPTLSYLGRTSYTRTIVPCEVVGDVVISGGTAKFNGGYIRCDNFNPPGTGVKEMSYFDMHVWAKNVGNQSANNVNPVFYHPNVSMSVPKATGFGGVPLFGLTTRRGSNSYTTSPRSVSSMGSGWYWFASQHFGDMFAHTLGSASYPMLAPSLAGLPPFSLNHDPQTVYIGYQPGHTPLIFYGEMDEITVDPQYGGDCC